MFKTFNTIFKLERFLSCERFKLKENMFTYAVVVLTNLKTHIKSQENKTDCTNVHGGPKKGN